MEDQPGFGRAQPIDQAAVNAEADRRRKMMLEAQQKQQKAPPPAPPPSLWDKALDVGWRVGSVLGFGQVRKQLQEAAK